MFINRASWWKSKIDTRTRHLSPRAAKIKGNWYRAHRNGCRPYRNIKTNALSPKPHLSSPAIKPIVIIQELFSKDFPQNEPPGAHRSTLILTVFLIPLCPIPCIGRISSKLSASSLLAKSSSLCPLCVPCELFPNWLLVVILTLYPFFDA